MKKLILTILALFLSTSGFTEEWQPHRLPFGNRSNKFKLIKTGLHAIVDASSGENLDVDSFYRRLSQADVVLIGEGHTNDTHHALQLRIMQGLHQRGHKVVLGLEMFNQAQNDKLDAYLQGQINSADFAAETGYFKTWGHNLRYYMPIFSYAKAANIPLRGVNIASERLKRLRSVNIASLAQALEDHESMPDLTSAEHRFFVSSMMQGISAEAGDIFATIYRSQCMWDANMAGGMSRLAAEYDDHIVVGLAGSAHVAYGLGIARLISSRSNLEVVTVMPVDIKEKKKENKDAHPGFAVHMKKHGTKPDLPGKIVSAGLADFLIGVPAEKHERYPAPLFKVVSKPEGLFVGGVMPGTQAYKGGFRRGDKIFRLNGKTWNDATKLQSYLHNLDWGDKVNAAIYRKNKKLTLNLTLKPEKRDSTEFFK